VKNPRRNILKCYALSFSWGFILLQAIMVPFFRSRDLSTSDIFVVQAVFALTLAVLDIPSGYFSDMFGRRTTLVIASVFKGLGGTALVFSQDMTGILVAYVLLGAANSFLSGSDVSLLYESHEAIPGENSPTVKLRGRSHFLGYLAITCGALLGGWLGEGSMETVAVVNAGIAWMSLPIALSMEEPTVRKLKRSEHWKNFRRVFRALFFENAFLRGLIFLTIVYTFAPTVSMYAFQTMWHDLHVPIAVFGYIGAVQNITSGLAGIYAGGVAARLGWTRVVVCIGVMPLVAFLGASTSILALALAGVLVLELLRVLIQVVLVDAINQQLPSEFRATANSLISFGNRLLIALGGPVVGALAGGLGTVVAFGALFAFYVVALFGLCLPVLQQQRRPLSPTTPGLLS
jgi:MFS family permease